MVVLPAFPPFFFFWQLMAIQNAHFVWKSVQLFFLLDNLKNGKAKWTLKARILTWTQIKLNIQILLWAAFTPACMERHKLSPLCKMPVFNWSFISMKDKQLYVWCFLHTRCSDRMQTFHTFLFNMSEVSNRLHLELHWFWRYIWWQVEVHRLQRWWVGDTAMLIWGHFKFGGSFWNESFSCPLLLGFTSDCAAGLESTIWTPEWKQSYAQEHAFHIREELVWSVSARSSSLTFGSMDHLLPHPGLCAAVAGITTPCITLLWIIISYQRYVLICKCGFLS